MNTTNTTSIKTLSLSLVKLVSRLTATTVFLFAAFLLSFMTVYTVSPPSLVYYYAFVFVLSGYLSFHAAFLIQTPKLYFKKKIWRHYALPKQVFSITGVVLFTLAIFLLPKVVDFSESALEFSSFLDSESPERIVLGIIVTIIAGGSISPFICGILNAALNLNHNDTSKKVSAYYVVATLFMVLALKADGLLCPVLFLTVIHLSVFDVTKQLALPLANRVDHTSMAKVDDEVSELEH